jgi:hypothetical protein
VSSYPSAVLPIFTKLPRSMEFSEVRSLLETVSHQAEVLPGGCASATTRIFLELTNEAETSHLSAPPSY